MFEKAKIEIYNLEMTDVITASGDTDITDPDDTVIFPS